MIIRDWLSSAKQSIDRLDAELILLHYLPEAHDRSWIISHDDEILDVETLNKLNASVAERMNSRPLAYILGYKEFYGRNFIVNKNTLIPRPETEAVIDFIKEIPVKNAIEIGTGSGIIAISAKLEKPALNIVATDIKTEAIAVAKKNAAELHAEVDFLQANLLSDIDITKFDTFIANLPYVNEKWDWLDRKSLDYEPASALYAKDGGLALIFELIRQINSNGKYLILESDVCQHADIAIFAQKFGWILTQTNGYIQLFERK